MVTLLIASLIILVILLVFGCACYIRADINELKTLKLYIDLIKKEAEKEENKKDLD